MVRHLLLTIAGFGFLEAAALACSCANPASEAEFEENARRIAVSAAAIAEVELAEPINVEKRQGEVYRVVRTLFGESRPSFRIARELGPAPDGSLRPPEPCGFLLEPGKRQVMVFFSAGAPWEEADAIAKRPLCGVTGAVTIADYQAKYRSGLYKTGGLCDQLLFREPGMVDRIRRAARAMGRDPG